jgi:hypothetical protein
MGGCSITGQLTISRFRGDTTFGLVTRIGSTLFGGIVGLVVWYVLLSFFHLPSLFFKWQNWHRTYRYIAAGDGLGNPYGFAAVCAVTFPFFFFGRLYWAVAPMTNIIFSSLSRWS